MVWSLWVGRRGLVVVGWLLWVGRCGLVVVVWLLWVGCYESVAMSWLHVGCCGSRCASVAVGGVAVRLAMGGLL